MPRPDLEAEFAAVRSAAYLNHAASAPLPRRSADRVRRYLEDRERLFHLYQAGHQDYDASGLKAKLARLLNAPVGSIGFVPTTCDGIAGVLNGIDWRRGDNVVFPANDFPGVVYPCLALEKRGVEARSVPVTGHLSLDDLLGRVDGRTRAVAVSHVHWQTGHRIDLHRLGSACRSAGVLSIVDAIQSVGVVPIDVAAMSIDLVVAGSYKWLLAFPGVAALYASEPLLAAVIPDRIGWAGSETSVYDTPRLAIATDARRFLVGGPADPTLAALDQSVGLLLETGIEAIATHVGSLLDRLIAGLGAIGLAPRSSLAPADRSAILSVSTGDRARDDHLTKELVARGVIVARRGPGIRIAPHLHNRAEDIDRFLATADAILRQR